MKYYSESELGLRYGTESSAGIDLPFYDKELQNVTLQPGETRKIKTGIYMEIPDGHVGFLDTRSSSGEVGIDLMCRTIDWDYRGNIRLMIINHGSTPLTVERGQFIAQIVIMKLNEDRELERVNSLAELSQTKRGDGAFGSTGGGLSKSPLMTDPVQRVLDYVEERKKHKVIEIDIPDGQFPILEEHRMLISHKIGEILGGEIRMSMDRNMSTNQLTLKILNNI